MTISHEEVLNEILANCCPQEKDGDISVIVLEGHCMMFKVMAKLVSTMGSIQYEILSMEMDSA